MSAYLLSGHSLFEGLWMYMKNFYSIIIAYKCEDLVYKLKFL